VGQSDVSEPEGGCYERSSIGYTVATKQGFEVLLHTGGSDREAVRDFLVCASGRHQLHDSTLARR